MHKKNPPVAEGGMEACELPRATDHRRQKERHSYSKFVLGLSMENFIFFEIYREKQGI